VLFGIGSEADGAARAQLTRQTPIRMLTSWYNGPGDLGWMTGWRTTLVPREYAAGYALHLVVHAHTPEVPVATAYGPACGRAYPLSDRFIDDMRQLARTFAGPSIGPPLYVTLFTEFQTFPCQDNAWARDQETTRYYLALKDRYRAAYHVFHQYAANAHVALGWGGWQNRWDDPAAGGGRSMFPYFADIMAMSDFQSFQAMDSVANVTDIADMTAILGRYGPVMLAHYKPDSASKSTFDTDVRAIFTDAFMAREVSAGLFAFSFMDSQVLNQIPDTFRFVHDAVFRYWRPSLTHRSVASQAMPLWLASSCSRSGPSTTSGPYPCERSHWQRSSTPGGNDHGTHWTRAP
jgi:hypothetical protein